MRGFRVGLIALLPVVFATTVPTHVYGQDAAATEAYFRAVAGHFGVPASEVSILAEGRGAPEQAPVVLFLSKRSGVSSSALLAVRRRTPSWAAVADRYGMGAATFHVRLPAGIELGPLAGVYEQFGATPPGAWGSLELSDSDLVALVNVRFLSEFLDVDPQQVVEAFVDAGSFVGAYERLLNVPGR